MACEPAAGGGSSSASVPETPEALSAEFSTEGGELAVFAAASLVDDFADIVDQIQNISPNVSITVESSGSQTLVTQLQEGAGADVLATANISTMTTTVEDDLIHGYRGGS